MRIATLRFLQGLFLLGLPLFFALGCQSVLRAGSTTMQRLSLDNNMERLSIGDTLAQADKRFGEKQYRVAAALYRQFIDESQDDKARERVYVQMGRCYYNDMVRSVFDAQSVYEEYLVEYPNGAYRQQVEEELNRLEIIRANRVKRLQLHFEQAAGDVSKLEAAVENHPNDANLQRLLGNALWDVRRFDDAVQHYKRSIEIDAALQEYHLYQKRMLIDEKGNAVPITPEMQLTMENESNPLVVYDMHEYKSRQTQNEYAAGEAYYNVQGRVRNQSSSTQQNVMVEVTFYNPSREQLDVQKDAVGDMPPGAVRAFGVQASRYDDIYNIQSYEVKAYGQR